MIEKLIWFNKIINKGLGKDPLIANENDLAIEKDRSDFYSRFFCFITNKFAYSENSHKMFNNREYLEELLKMLTNPESFSDRFVCLKTYLNVNLNDIGYHP